MSILDPPNLVLPPPCNNFIILSDPAPAEVRVVDVVNGSDSSTVTIEWTPPTDPSIEYTDYYNNTHPYISYVSHHHITHHRHHSGVQQRLHHHCVHRDMCWTQTHNHKCLHTKRYYYILCMQTGSHCFGGGGGGGEADRRGAGVVGLLTKINLRLCVLWELTLI